MFEKIIALVSDWPGIVQGALGSALFWLALTLGQQLATFTSTKLAARSRKLRYAFVTEEILRYTPLSTEDFAQRAAFVSLLLLRASRSLFKALIWLTLGLAFASVISILGLVGFMGCLYYLFAALNSVRAPEHVEDVEAKLQALKAEQKQLKDDGEAKEKR